MSASYSYVNRNKGQYFSVGLFEYSSSFLAAGTTYSARALALLISENGNWKNDCISLVSDYDEEFVYIQENYIDISVEAELLILDVDGIERFVEVVEIPEKILSVFSLYAHTLKRKDVTYYLNSVYGSDEWIGKYFKKNEISRSYDEAEVYKARDRKIELYNT